MGIIPRDIKREATAIVILSCLWYREEDSSAWRKEWLVIRAVIGPRSRRLDFKCSFDLRCKVKLNRNDCKQTLMPGQKTAISFLKFSFVYCVFSLPQPRCPLLLLLHLFFLLILLLFSFADFTFKLFCSNICRGKVYFCVFLSVWSRWIEIACGSLFDFCEIPYFIRNWKAECCRHATTYVDIEKWRFHFRLVRHFIEIYERFWLRVFFTVQWHEQDVDESNK